MISGSGFQVGQTGYRKQAVLEFSQYWYPCSTGNHVIHAVLGLNAVLIFMQYWYSCSVGIHIHTVVLEFIQNTVTDIHAVLVPVFRASYEISLPISIIN